MRHFLEAIPQGDTVTQICRSLRGSLGAVFWQDQRAKYYTGSMIRCVNIGEMVHVPCTAPNVSDTQGFLLDVDFGV